MNGMSTDFIYNGTRTSKTRECWRKSRSHRVIGDSGDMSRGALLLRSVQRTKSCCTAQSSRRGAPRIAKFRQMKMDEPLMKNENLVLYLNDHLAGSVGALELLDRLIRTYEDRSIVGFCREMKSEVEADQQVLRDVMTALDIEESSLRKASAWVAEKFSRAKLAMDGNESGEIGLVEALEGLVLGIKGKEGLWSALAAIQATWPPLKSLDFSRLKQRAIEQGMRVDAMRLKAATEAFQPNPA